MHPYNVEVQIKSQIVETVQLQVYADNASQIKETLKEWPKIGGQPNIAEPFISRAVIVKKDYTATGVESIRILEEEDSDDDDQTA